MDLLQDGLHTASLQCLLIHTHARLEYSTICTQAVRWVCVTTPSPLPFVAAHPHSTILFPPFLTLPPPSLPFLSLPLSFLSLSHLPLFHLTLSLLPSSLLPPPPSSFPPPVFGSEKRSPQMPIQISTLIAAHSSLWVGTENGVLVSCPFTAPAVVAEESGWELIKVRGHKPPNHLLYYGSV